MEIDPNKKYAIVPTHHMAIPLEQLADLMANAMSIERGYESNHGYRFSLLKSQQIETIIIDGDQILADTAIARMSENKS